MNDRELIWERYKLISEIPASLEFMGDDPEITSKLEPNFKPVQKTKKPRFSNNSLNSRNVDVNAWTSEKARELMKSTVQTGTAKGLDKRRQAQGKAPLIWKLVDANLEQEIETSRYIISKSDLTDLVNSNPSIKQKLSTPNGITVIMTPSGQAERSGIMAFSSWIRSHKCGHAILEYRKNADIDNNIKKVLNDYYKLFKESLSLIGNYKLSNRLNDYPILKIMAEKGTAEYGYPDPQKYYRDPEIFYMDFFTFGSARNRELIITDIKEELVAQLMQTGKITVNKMIDNIILKKMNDWFGNIDIENLLNIEEYIANQIDQAIENCIGEILYDVV